MQTANSQKVTLSFAAQTTMRMLIASHFIAAAAGSIPGADISALFSSFLPGRLAEIVGGSLVFLLGVMVMLGTHTRIAALLLGLITFYASYVELISVGGTEVLGAFWRDMALVAALMLTYSCDGCSARRIAPGPLDLRRIPRTRPRDGQTGGALAPITARSHAPRPGTPDIDPV
ncbi:hypothetical protein N8I71_15380 [Roseibacterium sp. SDUM158016]|uniref:hypothetical protein n=1 Tax=Roseicyclus sediminis TaxID=2980997 RepID=UPI0021D020DD|nr:hypothetical protein [Roseibacterium sp. SDUM158016]MCU4654225.1 hypothetical protein [Roseibacterium sp. SDUM158016]